MKQKISKTQLIDLVYDNVENVQLKQVDAVVNSFLDELSKALSDAKSVEIRGFGSFEVLESKSRKMTSSENTKSYRVKFKPGKQLKENLKNIKSDKKNEKK